TQVKGPGPVTLVLTFFGKALREAGVDGPYSIRAVHGTVKQTDEQGMQSIGWSHPQPLTTRRYQASDFADAEWDAPEKQQKIGHYQALIQAAQR
ncbi:MAG: hypothetical protein MUC69_00925, partial [Gemmatimonadales bacterium]|nr:hypothetical protein [Gemmatimonadales bacterium]